MKIVDLINDLWKVQQEYGNDLEVFLENNYFASGDISMEIENGTNIHNKEEVKVLFLKAT